MCPENMNQKKAGVATLADVSKKKITRDKEEHHMLQGSLQILNIYAQLQTAQLQNI